MSMISFKMLKMSDGTQRCFQKIDPQPEKTDLPGIVFLAGHGSDMMGSKAEYLAEYAHRQGLSFLRFDYFGHGQSDGELEQGNLSIWVGDAITMLDKLTTGPQILVGSSLGGWVMLRLAQERAERIAGLVGIAAAPDFTERLIWSQLDQASQHDLKEKGFIAVENPYSDEDVIYTYDLVEDGKKNLVLNHPIEFEGPVFLHHGLQDEEVPYETAFDIAQKLQSPSCRLIFDKSATHRYSEPQQLDALQSSIDQIYAMHRDTGTAS